MRLTEAETAKLIERLRETDAVWQKQCDGWVENWKAIGGMDADEVARLRRTVYAEAADALASKDKALSEARQYIAKLQTQNIMEIGVAVHQAEVAGEALSEMRVELERVKLASEANADHARLANANFKAMDKARAANLERATAAEAQLERMADCLDCARMDWEGNNGEIINKADPHWSVEARRLTAAARALADGETP